MLVELKGICRVRETRTTKDPPVDLSWPVTLLAPEVLLEDMVRYVESE